METKRGTSRMVYLDEKIAFKLPHYRFVKDIPTSLRRIIKEGRPHTLSACLSKAHYDALIFGKGVAANLVEAVMGVIARDVVVPTRMSIAGLVNIQDRAVPSTLPMHEIEKVLRSYFQEEPLKDMHGCHDPTNYGVHNGELKLIDCGSLPLARIILKKRHEFRSALLDLKLMNEFPDSE